MATRRPSATRRASAGRGQGGGGRGGQGACGGTRKFSGGGPNRNTTRQPAKKRK